MRLEGLLTSWSLQGASTQCHLPALKRSSKNLPTHCPCPKRRDCALCVEARKGIRWRLLHPTIPTGRGGQIQCYLSRLHNCQSHLTSCKVGNCGICRKKSTWSDWFHIPPSLGNRTGLSRGNPQPDCRTKAKHLCHGTYIQSPLCTKDPDLTPTISSSHWSSSYYSCLVSHPSFQPAQCVPQLWCAYGIRKSTSGWHMPSL